MTSLNRKIYKINLIYYDGYQDNHLNEAGSLSHLYINSVGGSYKKIYKIDLIDNDHQINKTRGNYKL
jgi:hypothetical protein